MKLRHSSHGQSALTLVEILIIVLTLATLVALVLPALQAAKRTATGIACVNNLRHTGVAFQLWAAAKEGNYPMEVSITNGGTMELAAGNNAWINFFVMSNVLKSSKILACPADVNRIVTTNFGTGFDNRNISYFVNLDVNTHSGPAFLAGDDNFASNGIPVRPGFLELSTNFPIAWTSTRHFNKGNILLVDGSVRLLNNSILSTALQQTGLATNRLALP